MPAPSCRSTRVTRASWRRRWRRVRASSTMSRHSPASPRAFASSLAAGRRSSSCICKTTRGPCSVRRPTRSPRSISLNISRIALRLASRAASRLTASSPTRAPGPVAQGHCRRQRQYVATEGAPAGIARRRARGRGAGRADPARPRHRGDKAGRRHLARRHGAARRNGVTAMRWLSAGLLMALLALAAAGARAAEMTAEQVRAAVAAAGPGHPVDLAGKNLEDLDLSGLDLEGANLTGADFHGAKLVDANLAHADLTGARLDLAW